MFAILCKTLLKARYLWPQSALIWPAGKRVRRSNRRLPAEHLTFRPAFKIRSNGATFYMCVLAMTEVVRVVHRRNSRRRSVGKAYDTAIEVADLIPPDTRLLDVGCGNGYVAHHLNALLTTRVTGVDLPETAKARIEYLSYDGRRLPVTDGDRKSTRLDC